VTISAWLPRTAPPFVSRAQDACVGGTGRALDLDRDAASDVHGDAPLSECAAVATIEQIGAEIACRPLTAVLDVDAVTRDGEGSDVVLPLHAFVSVAKVAGKMTRTRGEPDAVHVAGTTGVQPAAW